VSLSPAESFRWPSDGKSSPHDNLPPPS
jgi:hypothetical protein